VFYSEANKILVLVLVLVLVTDALPQSPIKHSSSCSVGTPSQSGICLLLNLVPKPQVALSADRHSDHGLQVESISTSPET